MVDTTPSRPDPAGGADRRRLTAVVYADLAGYSRLIGEDDAGTWANSEPTSSTRPSLAMAGDS